MVEPGYSTAARMEFCRTIATNPRHMNQIAYCLLALLFSVSSLATEGNARIWQSTLAAKGVTRAAEAGLNDAIAASGMSNRAAGNFFGWGKGATLTKPPSSFTREGLEAAGWSKDKLANLAKAYRDVNNIAPNPAAPVRAEQIESMLKLFQ